MTQEDIERVAEQQPEKVWTLESWAFNPDAPWMAVKVHIKLYTEPDANTKARFRGRAQGLYRSTYGVWAEGLGDKVA